MEVRTDGLCHICVEASATKSNGGTPRYCGVCFKDLQRYAELRRQGKNLTVSEMNFVHEMNERLDNMDYRYAFTGKRFRP